MVRRAKPSSSPPVRLTSVTKVFDGQRALDGITTVIPSGQFVAVIGRSGAGKTTLLRCLAGSAAPTGGVIRFGDDDVSRLAGRALRAHRARVGMIFQQFNLVRRLTVLDNVRIGRLAHLRGWRR